jgi:MFS family permease
MIPMVRRTLLIVMLAGAANSALLIHQVSALQAGGLTIGAASGFAGARGGFQLAGRILLVPLTNAVGTRGAMTACYGAAITAVVALIGLVATGFVPLVLYFAVIGGMSLGLLSPLHGLFQAEAYGDEWLGRLNGVSVILVGVGGAAVAWLVGLLADKGGGFVVAVTVIAILQLIAMLLVTSFALPKVRHPRSDGKQQT